MKVCFIARGVPSKGFPLLGIFEWDQAKALMELGHEVVYIALDLRSIRRKRKIGFRQYSKEGIKIVEASIPIGNIPRKFLKIIGQGALKIALNIAERAYGPFDIIHSHFIGMAEVASGILKPDHNHVITEHSSDINKPLSSEDIKRYQKVYSTANAVISVSKSLQKRIAEVIGIDNVCIHNIVDTDVFSYIDRKEDYDEYNFITVGNLTENKHIDLVVEALSEIKTNAENVGLTIIGDGNQRKYLEKLIDELGLHNHVKLLGRLDRNDIFECMQNAHCFVLPSRSETFGVAYIEALAAGLPVIATMCGGPEDFVDSENGYLIPVDDKEALVDAMMKMCIDDSIFDRKNISEKIKEMFSSRVIATQIETVYLDTLRGTRER